MSGGEFHESGGNVLRRSEPRNLDEKGVRKRKRKRWRKK
jgi:hypothetical protein